MPHKHKSITAAPAPASQTPCTFASRGSVPLFQALAEVQPLLSRVPSPPKPEAEGDCRPRLPFLLASSLQAAARLFLRFGVGLAPPALLVATSPACSCGVGGTVTSCRLTTELAGLTFGALGLTARVSAFGPNLVPLPTPYFLLVPPPSHAATRVLQ